jgi:hypothetical protein
LARTRYTLRVRSDTLEVLCSLYQFSDCTECILCCIVDGDESVDIGGYRGAVWRRHLVLVQIKRL